MQNYCRHNMRCKLISFYAPLEFLCNIQDETARKKYKILHLQIAISSLRLLTFDYAFEYCDGDLFLAKRNSPIKTFYLR